MDHYTFKTLLLDELEGRNVWFRKVSNKQVRTRCPFCGDSTKHYDDGHFYIRIDPKDTDSIVYNCFLCPKQGVLGREELVALGINNADLLNNIDVINRTGYKHRTVKTDVQNIFWDYPDIRMDNPKVIYTMNRIGYRFNRAQLSDIRIITSLYEFAELNHIELKESYYTEMLEKEYVGFVSSMGGHIIFRDISEFLYRRPSRNKLRWIKFPLSDTSEYMKSFYTIASEVDLFSRDDLIINMAEGVMDILSVAYNLATKNNSINIAICGKSYVPVFKYWIGKGFLGRNVIVNIFSDRDLRGNEYDIHIESYMKQFKYLRYLVKEVNIFYNRLGKDFGVPKQQIELEQKKIL